MLFFVAVQFQVQFWFGSSWTAQDWLQFCVSILSRVSFLCQCLIPKYFQYFELIKCVAFFRCTLRKVRNDGSVVYENGDRTLIPVSDPSKTRCGCGSKHFWNNQLYDNPPFIVSSRIFVLRGNWSCYSNTPRAVWPSYLMLGYVTQLMWFIMFIWLVHSNEIHYDLFDSYKCCYNLFVFVSFT